jgi:hypothetical protein
MIEKKFDVSSYDSTQARFRLSCNWSIKITGIYDPIKYPKNIAGEPNQENYHQMYLLSKRLTDLLMFKGADHETHAINIKTKTGPEKREVAEKEFTKKNEKIFRLTLKKAERREISVKKEIAKIQAEQKILLKKMRAINSDFWNARKQANDAKRESDRQAIFSGDFWKASQEAIKAYFHPPFDKNYLADVSEKWRAALFMECESVNWKGYNGEWRHKLAATGNCYLCGIDDNGDEWGIRCNIGLNHDQYGNGTLEGTVEEAMSEIFSISQKDLANSHRQGDLLFCPKPIPSETVLWSQEKWEVRESHEIWSPSLRRNGRYFRAAHEIMVSHTSHAALVLDPGEYQLYLVPKAVDPD